MLTEHQIEQRLPVWHALSELFLDTELQPDDYRRIAGVLAGLGFSPAQLRSILEDEVAPAFAFNLLSVAGEWTSWHEDDVREIMVRSLRAGRTVPSMNWLKKRLFRRYLDGEWAKIASLIATG